MVMLFKDLPKELRYQIEDAQAAHQASHEYRKRAEVLQMMLNTEIELSSNRTTMIIQLRDEIDCKNIAMYGLVVFSVVVCFSWFVVSGNCS